MSRLMVIGCGGVASVAVHKCCQNSGVFTELMIASRTKSKCDALKAQLEGKTDTVITTAQVDADKVEELEELIRSYKPDAVLNVALPYQDLYYYGSNVCVQVWITLIQLIMRLKIQMIHSGELFMKKRRKEKGFTHTLIIPGSGI